MTRYAYPIDLHNEPPTIAIDGDDITLSQNIVRYDNTGLWGAEQICFSWPDHPALEEMEKDFWFIWQQRMAEVIAASENERYDEQEGIDALTSGLYEQVLLVQEGQESTDAVLCDLYESMRNEG